MRGDCGGGDAIAWNAGNPGGTGRGLPRLVCRRWLDVRGTPEKPVVFKKRPGDSAAPRRGLGGVYMLEGPGSLTASRSRTRAGRLREVRRAARAARAPPACDNHQPPFCEDFQPSRIRATRTCMGTRRTSSASSTAATTTAGRAGRRVSHRQRGRRPLDSVTKPVALGLYGCGVATNVSNVEVAHADGVGIELRGGAALVRNAAVWASPATSPPRPGYRRDRTCSGRGRRPNRRAARGGRRRGDGGQDAPACVQLHCGERRRRWVLRAWRRRTAPCGAVGVVSAANGAGLSLLNTIVLSRSNRRSRALRFPGARTRWTSGTKRDWRAGRRGGDDVGGLSATGRHRGVRRAPG